MEARQKLIDEILAVLKGTDQEMSNYRTILRNMPDKELEEKATQARRKKAEIENENILDPIRQETAQRMAQADADAAFDLIRRTVVNGRVIIGSLAERKIIESWLHPEEVLTPRLAGNVQRWFWNVLQETPSLANQLQWKRVPSADSPQQLKADQELFARAARQLRLANVQANFSLIRQVLGPGFTIPEISNAIQSGRLNLARASAEEIEQWQAEEAQARIEKENAILASDDPGLRQQQKEIRQQRFAKQTQNAQQQEQERRLNAAIRLGDGGLQYPPLPRTWNGQVLNTAFMKSCDRETFKTLMKQFGSVQLNKRIAGLD